MNILKTKMTKIVGNRSTGKTGRLFLLAKENNGIIVCKNVDNMVAKAHRYGLIGIDFISYSDYIKAINDPNIEFNINHSPVYIDDISEFIKAYDIHVVGYSDTLE